MREEIKRRKNDSLWDHAIANGVLSRRKRVHERNMYIASFSSLAMAASLAVIFLFGLNNVVDKNAYQSFIADQINGTNNMVFANDAAAGKNYSEEDLISVNGVDSVIDDTLVRR